MGWTCNMHGKARSACRILVGNLSGKRPLGKSRRRWDDIMKIKLRKVGYEEDKWMELAQDFG